LTLFVCLSVQIQLLYPHPGFVEMDEMLLWQQVQDVIKDAISSDVISYFVLCSLCTFSAFLHSLGRKVSCTWNFHLKVLRSRGL